MTEIGIIPSPDSPYLELGESAQGARRFSKHILTVGETFVHPATGKPLTVDESWWSDLKKNWDEKVVPICQFPAADERNRHTENPLMNLGRVVDLRRQGNRIYADVEVPDPAVADKIGTTILGASAMLHMDYPDPRSGARRGKALVHVAATNRPHLVSLEPYSELVAACGEAFELPDGGAWSQPAEPLMLCASEVDPPVLLAEPDEGDYQHERDYRDYGGTSTMDEDRLRDDFDRLSLMAMQESVPGRGWRPQYGMVVTDADRRAAMSAEREVTDEDIMAASRELAGQHRVSTDAVLVMTHDCHVRSGLGRSVAERVAVVREVALSLGRGDLEVSDDQCLALAASGGSDYWVTDSEIIRLTADNEDILGLARHPSKSDRLVTSKTRAHSSEFDEDAQDTDQPARGNDVHKKLRELIERHPDLLSDGKGHEGGSGNRSHDPKSPARREREQRRAEGGHGRGARSIEDLAAGSRMYGR